jgi:hypothetical protein
MEATFIPIFKANCPFKSLFFFYQNCILTKVPTIEAMVSSLPFYITSSFSYISKQVLVIEVVTSKCALSLK